MYDSKVNFVCELFPLHSGNVRHFENFIHFMYMHTIDIKLLP